MEHRVTATAGDMDDLVAFDADLLIVHRRPSTMRQVVDGEERLLGLRAGSVIVLPRDTGVRWRWEHAAESVTLRLLPDHQVESRPALRPQVFARDRVLAQVTGWLAAELATGNPRGPLFADGLGLAVLGHLGWEDPGRGRGRAAGRLSEGQVRIVRDFMTAHLAQPIGVEELASLVGLTRSHFSRAFKAATGRAPHAYLLDLRTRHALGALMAGRQRLADLAAACGFADQAHMTRVLKARTGRTPGRIAGARQG